MLNLQINGKIVILSCKFTDLLILTPKSGFLFQNLRFLLQNRGFLLVDREILTPKSEIRSPKMFFTPKSGFLTPKSGFLTPKLEVLTPKSRVLTSKSGVLSPAKSRFLLSSNLGGSYCREIMSLHSQIASLHSKLRFYTLESGVRTAIFR